MSCGACVIFSIFVVAAVGTAYQEAPDACNIGELKCQDNVLMSCNVEVVDNGSTGRVVFVELDDCAGNADSGDTVCGELDGEPSCVQP